MRLKRPTMRDVADLAGVGQVTVSYVINGRSREARISPETETRVLEAAKELNYRPNAAARMLVTRRTNIIAVVLQRGSYFRSWSGFTAEVMRGLSTAAVEQNVDLMLHTREVEPTEEPAVLMDGRVDGALVLRDAGDPLSFELKQAGFPVVRFFSRDEGQDLPFVDADNVGGGRLATQHLIDLGHKRIGMIKGTDGSSSSNQRYQGYIKALVGAGIPVSSDYVLEIPSPESDCESLKRLLRGVDRPTAIFAWSDEVAFKVIEVAKDIGLAVPEQLSVIGFDSLPLCDKANPPLTSVRQPIPDIAAEAARLLIRLVNGEAPPDTQVLYPLAIDLRASTSPPCPHHSTVNS